MWYGAAFNWLCEGKTTGIAEMSDGRSKMEDVWFDLSGRRMGAKPAQRGVYINKGKKFVVK